MERGLVKHDIESVKVKFKKLAATNKQAGDNFCWPAVRKAKIIPWDIVNRAKKDTVSSSDEDECKGERKVIQRIIEINIRSAIAFMTC